MGNDGNSDKLKGSALLAGAAALIYFSRDKKPKSVPAPPPEVKPKPNVVTVNVNTGPTAKPTPPIRKKVPKPMKKPSVRFQGPISVSDRRFDAVPAVMPKDYWIGNRKHWVRNPNSGQTFKKLNAMYDELQGIDGGLEGRWWRQRMAARRMAARRKSLRDVITAARIRAARAAQPAGEAKMRRALEILRRNGMF